jgi:hypothetical protein
LYIAPLPGVETVKHSQGSTLFDLAKRERLRHASVLEFPNPERHPGACASLGLLAEADPELAPKPMKHRQRLGSSLSGAPFLPGAFEPTSPGARVTGTKKLAKRPFDHMVPVSHSSRTRAWVEGNAYPWAIGAAHLLTLAKKGPLPTSQRKRHRRRRKGESSCNGREQKPPAVVSSDSCLGD